MMEALTRAGPWGGGAWEKEAGGGWEDDVQQRIAEGKVSAQRRAVANAFDRQAAAYDRWFEENPLYLAELACLRRFQEKWPAPRLEIGVGPGRFAQALGIRFGVDLAVAPLRLARGRGVLACRAAGEALPFAARSFATVALLFTWCFLAEPALVLAEARRVLRPAGVLALAIIPPFGPAGRHVRQRRTAGHPLYRHAQLQEPQAVLALIAESGFAVEEVRSVLAVEAAADTARYEEGCVAGIQEQAVCLIVAARRENLTNQPAGAI